MILQQGGHVHVNTVAFVFQLLEFNTNCKWLRCVSNLLIAFHFRIDRQNVMCHLAFYTGYFTTKGPLDSRWVTHRVHF